jgi:dipeptidyl aminopeptidase/acylaminoacyl peptidase
MKNQLQKQPYGLWASPLSAALVSQRIRLDHVCWDSDGQTLVWLECRSGKGILVAQTGSEARRELTDEQNVRGGVGYGGGEFSVHKGVVFFADSSGQLYRRGLGQERPRPITPAYGSSAALEVSPDGHWVAYVHTDGKTDLIGMVQADGSQWPQQLVRGSDFYMNLAWAPAGNRLAWIEWDHPNMPWDGTRLVLAELQGEQPRVSSSMVVSGDAKTPVCQPQFSPDGQWLSYIISRGEWDDLELLNLTSGEKRVLVQGESFHLSTPGWVQGIRTYGWSADGRHVYTIRNYGGFFNLWVVHVESGRQVQMDMQPYTFLSQLTVSVNGQLAMVASAPNVPDRIVCLTDGTPRVVARSETESIAKDFLPVAKPVDWSAPDGSRVHGLYYAPSNPQYQADGLPPAIVDIHGGPTSLAAARYNPEVAYFTSRGYACLRVNYRGSTGYGYSYQAAMDQAWGLVDVEDAVGGAKALAEQKLADGRRLAISGGSAGGYTVLNTLIRFPGLYRVGINCFGVSNLFGLAMDTHKFEERYLDTMVGQLPEMADRYHAWSPIYHADQIRDPLAIFQGTEDKVVPPNQNEQIVAVLRQKGVPHIYRLYPGEGHGFRKNETLLDYYQQVETFLKQYLLFAPTHIPE